jgi:hypothetical protein
LRVDVANRAIFAAVIDELGRQNVADAQRHAILKNFLVHHRKAVARLDIEHEIDVVLENLRQVESNAIG